MKTIIAGGREITNPKFLNAAISKCGWTITEVVSGTARGVDQMGEAWAANNNVPVKRFPADWDGLGKRAGYIRNQAMAGYAEALVLVWDGQSAGSGHMLAIAHALKLKIYELIVKPEDIDGQNE